ncbi:MAG: hypothetical protein C5B53_05325 [Candidatus Melainabacteria bacterium]|nr:MAG: hypothetical protein C5B53_05325 [Candidatus Melainabacteria bacterium]
MNWQPPPPPPRPQQFGGPQEPAHQQQQQKPQELSFYELLQVDRDAHPTIIRYAYRFLAAMYHPDNAETGNADKFRIISEAWKTLSDDGKRQAYDMQLGAKEQSKAGGMPTQAKPSQFGRESLPQNFKTTLTWNEVELRLAILQVLLAARKQRPQTGGASGKMLLDVLNIDSIMEIEFALWYLREKGHIEMGERVFMITAQGVDYLTDALSKTEVLGGGGATEQKTQQAILKAGLPATTKK